MDRRKELKKLLMLAGTERSELAREMNVSRMLICHYVNGGRRITDEFWAKAEPFLLNQINEKRLELNRFEIEKADEPKERLSHSDQLNPDRDRSLLSEAKV